jgi:hypothetical protein
MASNAGQFSSTRQPNKTSKRRVFAENLLFSSLKERGSEMLDVLFRYAKEAEKEELRVRAAKEALTLMLPANNVELEQTENSEAMAQLRSQLSADEMARLNEILKPAMQGLLNDLIAKVKEGNKNETIS